jgi:hypothetical protein
LVFVALWSKSVKKDWPDAKFYLFVAISLEKCDIVLLLWLKLETGTWEE